MSHHVNITWRGVAWRGPGLSVWLLAWQTGLYTDDLVEFRVVGGANRKPSSSSAAFAEIGMLLGREVR